MKRWNLTQIRTAVLCIGLAISTMSSGCGHVQPVINAVVTCSGKTVPAGLVQEVYTDLMTENFADIALNIAPILIAGWQDVNCIINDLEKTNPEVQAKAAKFRAKYAKQLRGDVADQDNRDTKPAVVATSLPVEEGPYQPPMLTVESDWRTPRECGFGMHNVSPFAPGAVCMRDDVTWSQVTAYERKQCEHGVCEIGWYGSSPWSDAFVDLARARAFDHETRRWIHTSEVQW